MKAYLNKIYRRLFISQNHNQTPNQILTSAYQKIGVLNFGDENTTGEKYVLKRLVSRYVSSVKPIMFDVGANVGNYSVMLAEIFPTARIISFEPNRQPHSFLIKAAEKFQNRICPIRCGLGSTKDSSKILYCFSKPEHSSLGSVHKGMLELFEVNDVIEEIPFTIDTTDHYCLENGITHIDFMKIDVEGHELDVLKGAQLMLNSGAIKVIQFEFNEFNVFARVFMKDYFDILFSYNLYRILPEGLLPLGSYQTFYEIFKYQNILAIRKEIDEKIW